MSTETEDALRRELELVKASKRADRDVAKEYKELAVTLDETRKAYRLSIFERDLLVLDAGMWRARAIEAGWKEDPQPMPVEVEK